MIVDFFPDAHAVRTPDKPAYVVAESGQTVTYAELTDGSRRAARVMRALGAERGDCVAIVLENHPVLLQLAWAAQRAGLRYTTVAPRSKPDEIAYILDDSAACVVFAGAASADAVREATQRTRGQAHRVAVDVEATGFESFEALAAAQLAEPLPDEAEGVEFLYSSGTTGRPKAVSSQLPLTPIGTPPALVGLLRDLYGFDEQTLYLSPAPLYHSAPLRFNMAIHRLGGTCVVMARFDAANALRLIERYHVTHTQMVPTMFIRMLRLPPEDRDTRDLSSLQVVVHAAAPCPPKVKEEMIEWLGPRIYEYYSSTEVHLFTAINSQEWLAHRGSVGRALVGKPHILDDDGRALLPQQPGTIWSEGGNDFVYHNDPEKTAGSRNEQGWRSVGDVGYLDDDGYLYLTDRKADMIICGGTNVYPQEAENVLSTHPAVFDVAVFGIPHEELGEEVKAVVQPVPTREPSADLEAELIEACQQRLAKYKCPRSIDFAHELPRTETGKLLRRVLRERYVTQGGDPA